MKAVICTGYGPADVLKLAEIDKPVPRNDEILIRIHATTCHIGDTKVRGFHVPFWQMVPFRLYLGITKPKRPILGMELAGEIESVGRDVIRFQPGDKVFACTGFVFGGYAEYICMKENSNDLSKGMVGHMPDNFSFREAAAGLTSGGMTALTGLRKGNIAGAKKVMIYGASGSVGTYAVQLAKHYGTDVTAVCGTNNIEMVRSLGADRVIDYRTEDVAKYGTDYDLVFDAVGLLGTSKGKKLLNTAGKFTKVGTDDDLTIEDLYFLKNLAENGELVPVIDRIYPLDQIVEAHKYVEQGHKKGHVVVTVTE